MEFGSSYKYPGRTPSNTSPLSSADLQKGDTGASAPYLKVQYSDDNATWYDTVAAVPGDISHLRFSSDDEETWSSSVPLPAGASGAAGTNGENVLIRYGIATYGNDLLDGEGDFASTGSWTESGWSISGGQAQATNPTLPSGTGLYHALSSNTSEGDDLLLEFDVTQSSDNHTAFIVRLHNSTTFNYQDIYLWDDGGYIDTGHYEFNFIADGEYDQLRILTYGNNGTTVTIDNITIKGITLTWSDTPTGNVSYLKFSTDGGSNYSDPVKIGWNVNTVKIQFKDSTDPTDEYDDTYTSGDDVMRISKDGGVNWIEDIQIKGANGTDGDDGDSAYVYIAYASDDTGTDFTTTFNANLDYIAILSTTTELNDSEDETEYAGLWKKYKGETGTSQYNFIAYATDNTGTNGTLSPSSNIQYQYVSFLVRDENTTPDISEFSSWVRFFGFVSDNFMKPIDGQDGGDASVNPATIGDISYTDGGGGLDDMTVNEVFTGWSDIDYVVEIDGTGTPDTFKWSKDGGSTWEATTQNITGTHTLEEGVQVTFAATTGHVSGDKWEWTAEAPDDGDRYILEDVSTQGTTYHSSFGTIDKDTDGDALSLQDNDIVEADVTNEEFRIAFDANDQSSDRSVNVLTDKNGESNRLWTYFYDDAEWKDMGDVYLHNNFSDLNPVGVAGATFHNTETQLNALTQNNGSIDDANNFHYHNNAAEDSFTSADQDASYQVTFTHNLSAVRVAIMVHDNSGNEIPKTHYQVLANGANAKYIKFQGSIPGTYHITAIKPNIDSP